MVSLIFTLSCNSMGWKCLDRERELLNSDRSLLEKGDETFVTICNQRIPNNNEQPHQLVFKNKNSKMADARISSEPKTHVCMSVYPPMHPRYPKSFLLTQSNSSTLPGTTTTTISASTTQTTLPKTTIQTQTNDLKGTGNQFPATSTSPSQQFNYDRLRQVVPHAVSNLETYVRRVDQDFEKVVLDLKTRSFKADKMLAVWSEEWIEAKELAPRRRKSV